MKTALQTLCGFVLILCPLAVFAQTENTTETENASDSLPINPGLWEVTTTVTGAGPEPQTKTSQNCIRDTELNPQKMMQRLPPGACQVDTRIEGVEMSFDMNCEVEGMKMTSSGTMSVEGDVMSSDMDVSSSGGDQDISLNMRSEGRRVGDC